MSTLHLTQISRKVEVTIGQLIDMSDQNATATNFNDIKRSRALAAYITHHLSGCEPAEAAQSIVDGGNDNGVDAIYFHEQEEKLYIVQSKWIKDGKGEPDNGSIKKFCTGVQDLLAGSFDRFNEKVQRKASEIDNVLGIPTLRVVAVLVHTGTSPLSEISTRDFRDLANDINDPTEIFEWVVIDQGQLHTSLTEDLNSPITIEIPIRYWGKIQQPEEAIYGTVAASDAGQLWIDYKDRLVAKNLRSSLGDSDVNKEIRASLEKNPEHFWYYNNGITATARRVTKLAKGGSGTELGIFRCEELYVVNGAQTVSTIGAFMGRSDAPNLAGCFVPFRVIQLGDEGESFGDNVTRANNRQNKIVSQDAVQKRIRTELAIEKINYQIMRNEDRVRSDNAFDLQESTIALACALQDPVVVVMVKNQISKVWEDLSKSPYKALFNPNVTSMYVWNCVRVLRMIDIALEQKRMKSTTQRESRILSSGNRLIASLVFKQVNLSRFADNNLELDRYVNSGRIKFAVDEIVFSTLSYMHSFFLKAMIPVFFKNQSKSRELYDHVAKQYAKNQTFNRPVSLIDLE
jgi:AIPR protein